LFVREGVSVLCKKCGTELQANAKECVKCGQPRPGLPVAALVVLVVIIGAILWGSFSDNTLAQEFRDNVTGAQTQTIVDVPFSVEPQKSSYYKFTVPTGAVGVRLTGEFTAAGGSENNVEVYLLTDSAFVAWSNGYSTSNHYESGRVTKGSINAVLPPGAGVYYLVFSNKFSPKTPKAIHATALLHYRSLIGEWIFRAKDWLGL